MSLEERNVSSEHFAELTCPGVESLSPYGTSTTASSYTEPPTYYPTEYDWQHHHHHQMITPADRHYYSTYTDGLEIGGQAYHDYAHPAVTHADFYTPNMWQSSVPSDPLSTDQQQRFFSGIDLGSHGNIQQVSPSSSSSGKPKRKRVQSHTQRKAANVRERKRMFHLNEAFDELRKRLPAFNYEKRLSRIETLRLAMTYISFMKEVSVGRDPKCVKLRPHGPDLSPLSISSSMYKSGDMMEENSMNADSDCSNDELSNHSGAFIYWTWSPLLVICSIHLLDMVSPSRYLQHSSTGHGLPSRYLQHSSTGHGLPFSLSAAFIYWTWSPLLVICSIHLLDMVSPSRYLQHSSTGHGLPFSLSAAFIYWTWSPLLVICSIHLLDMVSPSSYLQHSSTGHGLPF
ncbi:hypothetical protein Btru_068538 [Bulinus truncatus]|nr:hypothetical protein Btru_068538 [Bulinus truncatus]